MARPKREREYEDNKVKLVSTGEKVKNKTDNQQLKWTKDYLQDFNDIKIRVYKKNSKGEDIRQKIKDHAKEQGKSLNEYVIDLISKDSGIDFTPSNDPID